MSNGIYVIGRAERMGLGTMTEEFCAAMDPDKVIVVDCDNGRTVDASRIANAKVVKRRAFSPADELKGASVVVGFETFYHNAVPEIGRHLDFNFKTVLFPMWEWSSHSQVEGSSLLVCLSETDRQWAGCRPMPYGFYVRYDWPASPFLKAKCRVCNGAGINDHGYPFSPCDRCPIRKILWPPKTFVHLAGNAAHNRDGTREVIQAARYLRGTGARLRLHASFTIPPEWSINGDVVELAGPCTDRRDLFDGADCLVCPRRIGGHSLPINEATGEGIPCIVPDLPDWAAFPYRVKMVRDGTFGAARRVDAWRVDVQELGLFMRAMALGYAVTSDPTLNVSLPQTPCPKLPTWDKFKTEWAKWMKTI